MKNLLFLSALFVTLCACNHPVKISVPANPAENFYKRFEGTIGDKQVVMHLNKEGKDYNGVYYAGGTWMNLLADTLISQDSIELFEGLNADYYWNKKDQSRLSLKLVNDQLEGKWMSSEKDTVLKVSLRESYPAGAEKFEIYKFSDSLAAFKDKKNSPMARFSFIFPVTENKELDNEMKKALGFKVPGAAWSNGVKEQLAIFYNDYRKAAKAATPYETDSMGSGFLNYMQHTTGHIKYNDRGFLVIDRFSASYTGGAHGYYYSTMLNFDVQQKKLLKLSDVINTDSLTLQKIMEDQFRKQYNVKPGESLKTVLFDAHLPHSNNFYFNKNGLGFIYNPYEVASYAQGQIMVFIPFKLLEPYLVPVFAQRMGL